MFTLNRKIKFFLTSLIVLGLSMPLEIAKAWVFDKAMVSLDALDFVDTHALPLIFELGFWLTVSQFFVHFAAKLLEWAMHLPIYLGNPLVQEGWNFILGFINLFFILFFVAIALCHILKIEIGKFTTTKILARLITVALLVNFSLVFVGIFTDIAQIILSYILGTFGSDLPSEATLMLRTEVGVIARGFFRPLGTYFAVALIPYANIIAAIYLAVWIFTTDFIALGILAMIITILSLLMGLVFLIFGLFFLVRIIVVWLLAIISPLMLAAWIFPSTEKYFRQWFNILVEWLFLGIVGIFVLGLGLSFFAQEKFAYFFPPGEAITIGGAEIFSKLGFSYLILIIYLFVTLYLMKTYLLPTGARDLIGKAEKFWKKSISPVLKESKLGSMAKGRISKIYGPKRGYLGSRVHYNKKTGKEESLRTGREKIERMPVIGKMVGGVGAYEREVQEKHKEASKEMEGASTQTLQTTLGKKAWSPEQRFKQAAALGHLIQKGAIDTETVKKHLPSAKSYGLDAGETLKAYPHLAPDFGKTIQEVTEKITPGDFRKNVQPEALKNLDVFYAMSPRQLEEIEKKGTISQKQVLFRELLPTYETKINTKIKDMEKERYRLKNSGRNEEAGEVKRKQFALESKVGRLRNSPNF